MPTREAIAKGAAQGLVTFPSNEQPPPAVESRTLALPQGGILPVKGRRYVWRFKPNRANP